MIQLDMLSDILMEAGRKGLIQMHGFKLIILEQNR